jgi:hypothetical protein
MRAVNLTFLFSHLFAVCGSGKTRLSLDGLCHNWGLYISCQATKCIASGSNDFAEASLMMQNMRKADPENAAIAANRAFAMFLCARIFVLKQLVRYLPVDTDPTVARRRWVLAQVLPPRLGEIEPDLFVHLLQSVLAGRTDIMRLFYTPTTTALTTTRPDLFPLGHATPIFVVIDEAQMAADDMKFFPSTTGRDLRPVLREMYSFFDQLFSGIILAGTGLLMDLVKDALSSNSAKRVGRRQPLVFTNTGRFGPHDPSHELYIRRYLTLSGNDISDRRLLERMLYGFSGRHVYPLMS